MDRQPPRPVHIWLISIAVCSLAIFLRLPSCYESLWLDELHSAWIISDGIGSVYQRSIIGHQSPCYYYVLWTWQELFGDSTSQSDTCSADKEMVQPEAVPAKPAGSVNTQSSAEVHEIPLSESEIYVIDSFALIYQLFFALPPMSGPSGQPVGAVHGYARDLIELIESKNPTHVIAVFDPPGEVFRHEFYPEYKANRDPMPDDLRNQIPNIKRILKAMGIAMLEVPNFEADDVMATVAHQIAQAGGNAYLVTSDKDCRHSASAPNVASATATNLSRRWGGLCVNAPFAKCAQSFASGLGFAPRDTASTSIFRRRAAKRQFMTAWYWPASSSPHLNKTQRAVDVWRAA